MVQWGRIHSLVGRTESDMTKETQHACMHWRRTWQPTPVFLPGESQGWSSLVGCHLQGRTESDTTEETQQQQQQQQCRRCKRCEFDPWVRKMPWSWKWQPAPVFLPGKLREQRSLAGHSPWGHRESGMTD